MLKQIGIGELAELTQCKVPTIRYYEQVGLMPKPGRTSGNQRRYTDTHRQRLVFIRHARSLGFSMKEVKQLVALQGEHVSDRVSRIARRHLESVQTKIHHLVALELALNEMVSCCESGKPHECRIMHVLNDHQLCSSDHETT